MKKVLFILAVVALFSCEEAEPELCWKCNKEIFAPAAYSSHVQIICDKTSSEISSYERKYTEMTDNISVVMTCTQYN